MRNIFIKNNFITMILCLVLSITLCTPLYAAESNKNINISTLSKEELKTILLNDDVAEDIREQAIDAYNKIIKAELESNLNNERYGYIKKIISLK